MTRGASSAATILSAFFILVPAASLAPLLPRSAVAPTPTQFRSAVDTVAIYATVSDDTGRLVPNLTRDDFQVFDNGAPVEIALVSNERQPIWDAIYRAIESFPESGARRAIVMVTDGRATGNTRSIDDVARAAMRHRVSISIVGQDEPVHVRQSPTTYVAVRPGSALQWLADVTGGVFISATERGERPAGPLRELIASLRQTYTLTFEAPALDGRPHTLQVHVLGSALKVRARSLYVGPG